MDHITVIPSKRFVQILQELCTTFGALDSIKDKLSSSGNSYGEIKLTTQEIKWCHLKMRERGIPERVHELLEESEVILPKYEPPPRNPELEARIQKLRAKQENREYNKMVESVCLNKGSAYLGDVSEDLKSVNRQIVSGAQYLLSIVGTFFGVFMVVGMATPDYGIRALLATLSALVVGLAEIYFIIKHDIWEEERKKKHS